MAFFLSFVVAGLATQAAAITSNQASLNQQPLSSKPISSLAIDDNLYLTNPSNDCKYVSQPYIHSEYKKWTQDPDYIALMLAPDVDFTVVGNHPISGHYSDFRHFYVNAIWRIKSCVTETYPADFKMKLLHIHGACDEEWSVQEVEFTGRANNGMYLHFPFTVCPRLFLFILRSHLVYMQSNFA